MDSVQFDRASSKSMVPYLETYKNGDENSVLRFLTDNRENLEGLLVELASEVKDREGARSYIRSMRAGWLLKKYFCFGVWIEAPERSLIGEIVLFNITSDHKSAEIGYYIDKDFRGKGFGRLMLRKVVSQSFSQLGFSTLSAKCDFRNKASRATALQCGFKEKMRIGNVVVLEALNTEEDMREEKNA